MYDTIRYVVFAIDPFLEAMCHCRLPRRGAGGGGRPPRGLGKPRQTIQSPDRLYKAQQTTQRHELLDKTFKILDMNPKYLTRVANSKI